MSAVPGFAGEEAANTDKAFRSLQARCALAGAALEPSTDDHDRPVYILTRGPVTVRLASIGEVEGWLRLAAWVRQRTEGRG